MSARASLTVAIVALSCSVFAVYLVFEDRDTRRGDMELGSLREEVDSRLAGIEQRLAQLVDSLEEDKARGERTARIDAGESEDSADVISTLARLEARIRNLELRATANDEDPIARGFAYLNSEDASVRKRGVNLLRKFGRGDQDVIAVLRQALDDGDAAVRKEALEGLKDAGDDEAIPRIAELLKDPDSGVREKATEALAALLENPTAMAQNSTIPQSISELLADESDKVRVAAADALGELGSASSVPALVDTLRDPATDVREEVIESLVQLEARSAIPELQALYDTAVAEIEREHSLRLAAALKELGEGEPLRMEVERLARQAANGADAESRERAIRTLAWLKAENQVGVYEQALNDPDEGVRRAARAALSGGSQD